MSEGKHEEGCCGTSSPGGKGNGCCCGKKVVVSILIGLLLFGAGYYFGKGGLCSQPKMCPMTQAPMQHQ